jgi:hypothetical protein
MVDKNYPMQRLEETMAEAGAQFPKGIAGKPTTKLKLHPGVVGRKYEKLDKEIEPIFTQMAKDKLTQGEVGMVAYDEIRPHADKIAAYKTEDFRTAEANQAFKTLKDAEAELESSKKTKKLLESDPESDMIEKGRITSKIEKLEKETIPAAQKAWDEVEKVDPEKPGSGLTKKRAEEMLAPVKKQGKYEKAKKAVAQVQTLMIKTARDLYKNGLYSKDDFSRMIKATKGKYVPLWDEKKKPVDFSTIGVMRGKGYSTTYKEQARYGMDRMVDPRNIVSNAMEKAYKAQYDIARNDVAKSIYYFAKANLDPDYFEIDPAPAYKYVDDADGFSRKVLDTAERPHFDVMLDGEPQRIYPNMDNPIVAKAMAVVMGDNKIPTGMVLRTMSAMQGWMKLFITGLNPDFAAANFTRDTIQSAFTISAEKGEKIYKEARGAWGKNIAQNMLMIAGEDITAVPKVLSKEFEAKRKMWELYLEKGARTDFRGMVTAEDLTKRFQKIEKEVNQPKGVKIAKAATVGAFKLVMDINHTVENVWRFSAFEAMVKNGIDPTEAALYARRMTVDFNQRGSSPTANSLYIFASVAFSSTERFLEIAKNNPKKLAMFMSKIAGMGMALNIYNELMGGQDETGESKWGMKKGYEKNREMVIMDPRGTGKSINIPMPYIYHLPLAASNIVSDVYMGRKKPAEALGEMFEETASSMTPFGGSNLEGQQFWANTFTPTILHPFLYSNFGVDWTGRPLYPEMSKYTMRTDPYRYRSSTAEPYIWAAQKIHEMAGGDMTHENMISNGVSPATLQMIVETVFGGLGATANRLFNLGDASLGAMLKDNKEDKEKLKNVSNYPIIRRFIKSTYEEQDYAILRGMEKSVDFFRSAYQEADKHWDAKQGRFRKPKTDTEDRALDKKLKAYEDKFMIKKLGGGGNSTVHQAIYTEYDSFKEMNREQLKYVGTLDAWNEKEKVLFKKLVRTFARGLSTWQAIEYELAQTEDKARINKLKKNFNEVYTDYLQKTDTLYNKLKEARGK